MTPRDPSEGGFTILPPAWNLVVPPIVASENETAGKVIRTATALFAQQGYARTSIQDISEAADASKGSIFHYIKAKSDLLRAIVVLHYRSHLALLDEINRRDADPGLPGIASFIALYIDFLLVADTPRTLIVDREWRELEESDQIEILKIIDVQRHYLREQIVIARKLGQVNGTGSPGVLASAIMGMLSWSHNWYRPDDTLDVTSMTRAMVDLVMYGLIARDPTGSAG